MNSEEKEAFAFMSLFLFIFLLVITAVSFKAYNFYLDMQLKKTELEYNRAQVKDPVKYNKNFIVSPDQKVTIKNE